MENRALVRRYTRGLAQSIRDERELADTVCQLQDFLQRLAEIGELNLALTSALLPAARKTAVADSVLGRMSYLPKTARFIHLLVKNRRLSILGNIVDSLPDVWDEEKGILSFEVASVVPLSEMQMEKLKEKLQALEQKPVRLKYKIDPGLIGGLSLRRGNIIYDASLMGALVKLKQKISEG